MDRRQLNNSRNEAPPSFTSVGATAEVKKGGVRKLRAAESFLLSYNWNLGLIFYLFCTQQAPL